MNPTATLSVRSLPTPVSSSPCTTVERTCSCERSPRKCTAQRKEVSYPLASQIKKPRIKIASARTSSSTKDLMRTVPFAFMQICSIKVKHPWHTSGSSRQIVDEMKPTARLKRNAKQLKLSVSSPRAFTATVRASDPDLLTCFSAIAIAYATQHVRSPNLLSHLAQNRTFLYRVGNRSQRAAALRAYLLANKRSYLILKPIITHLFLHVRVK